MFRKKRRKKKHKKIKAYRKFVKVSVNSRLEAIL